MSTQYNFSHLAHTHIKVFFSVFILFLNVALEEFNLILKIRYNIFQQQNKKETLTPIYTTLTTLPSR